MVKKALLVVSWVPDSGIIRSNGISKPLVSAANLSHYQV